MNPETKTEIRRLQRRIHELIETTSNDSQNHYTLIINPNVSHDTTTAITQLSISQKQS